MDSPNPDASLQKYRRLDAFLERLKGDVYPEPSSDLHTGLSERMFAQLQTVRPLASGAQVPDINLTTGAGPDTYWAFVRTRPA